MTHYGSPFKFVFGDLDIERSSFFFLSLRLGLTHQVWVRDSDSHTPLIMVFLEEKKWELVFSNCMMPKLSQNRYKTSKCINEMQLWLQLFYYIFNTTGTPTAGNRHQINITHYLKKACWCTSMHSADVTRHGYNGIQVFPTYGRPSRINHMMGWKKLHNEGLKAFMKHVTLRDALVPPHKLDIADACAQLQADISMFHKIQNTRYLNPCTHIPTDGSLQLAWEYAQNPDHYHLFIQMLRVSPLIFAVILHLI